MSVRIDTTLQTYLAAVTIPGDFSGLPDGDFEVALGSYVTPGTFQAPTAVSINGTVSVTLTGRLGAGKSFDPVAATYWLWGRATRSPDETLTRGPTMITVVTTGGVPVGPAIRYVPQQTTAPDPTVYEGWLDSSTSPPTLKGWNGTAWVAIGGGGGGAVSSVFTRTGAVVAASGDYAAFYDALGAATTAQAAAIAASQPLDSDLTAIAALATTAYGRSVLTQADAAALRTLAGLGTAATQASTAFDAAGAASTAQAAAIAAAATDATTKANAAQAASQPLDSDLTAIAALATTSFGRSFLALADAAAGRTLLGLGTLATQSGTFSGTSSGTNTGDQTLPTALPPNGAASGDLSGTYPAPNVAKINGTALSGLATGLLKNTTTTGVPSIAVGADIPNIAESQVTNLTTDLAAKAPLASPALTGSPTAPTQAANDNSTKVATTGYVDTASGLLIPKSLLTTKGDVIAASAASTPARVPVGSDGQVLTADAASTAGVKWAAAAAISAAHAFRLGMPQRSGFWYDGSTNSTARTSGAAGAGNFLYITPIYMPRSGTIDRLGVNVAIASSAGGLVRVGLYASDANFLPAALLVDGGDIDVTTTGAKEATVSQAVTADTLYYLAVTANGSSGSLSLTTVPVNALPGITLGSTQGSAPLTRGFKSFAYAALPNPFGTATFDTSPPAAAVRVRFV